MKIIVPFHMPVISSILLKTPFTNGVSEAGKLTFFIKFSIYLARKVKDRWV